jgi:hypothetical protein
MGGGASAAFHHLIGEHSLSDDQQRQYHEDYKALEATGMAEPQIIEELKNRLAMTKQNSKSARQKAGVVASTTTTSSKSIRRGSKDGTSSRPHSGESVKTTVCSTAGSSKSVRTNKACSRPTSGNTAGGAVAVPVDVPVVYHGPQPYMCEICVSTGYPTFILLEHHIRASAQHAAVIRERDQAKKKDISAQVEAVDAALALAAAVANDDVVGKEYVCEDCKVVFTTFFLLDRHIRFSDRHLSSVREREKRESMETRAKAIAKSTHNYLHFLRNFVVNSKSKTEDHSVPRKRWLMAYKRVKMDNAIKKTEKLLLEYYRRNKKAEEFVRQPQLLFRASKLFWRSQESWSMNLYVYHHDNEMTKTSSRGGGGVVEVVGYLAQDTHFEFSTRLYLDYASLCSLVKKELNVAIGKLQKKSQKSRRRSFQNSLLTGSEYSTDDKVDEAEASTVVGDIIGTLILDKIQLDRIPGSVQRFKLSFKLANSPPGGVDEPASSLQNSKSESEIARNGSDGSCGGVDCVLDESFAHTILSPATVSNTKINVIVQSGLDEVNKELAMITNRAEKLMSLVSSSMSKVQDLAVSSTQRAKFAYGSVLHGQSPRDTAAKVLATSSPRCIEPPVAPM